jgi:branched-chain amino acid aminotransferase
MTSVVVVNGTVMESDRAVISAFDRGFLFGDAVFETLVAFGGCVLDASKHWARLRRSAAERGIEIPWRDEELDFEVAHACSLVNAAKKSLRLVVTRGEGLGLLVSETMRPNRYLYVSPAPIQPKAIYQEGIALRLSRLTFTDRGFAPKTTNYARAITALGEAKGRGFDDVLWANSEGEITEATTSNIFFVGREGDRVEIVTPSVHSGLLPGTTRATLLELMASAGIRAEEKVLFVEELARFDEAFVCSTVRGLVPVNRIEGHRLHSGRSSSVYRQIERLFFAKVTRDLGNAVDWNTGAARS